MTDTPCIALMYHALYANEQEWQALTDDEKPYAVSTAQFTAHLEAIQANGLGCIDPEHWRQQWQAGVLITFDDGHISHYQHALPILAKFSYKAIFFVTTDFMDTDPRFCSWQQLMGLAKAGHSVQGHGHTHSFFADMPATQAAFEFTQSFEYIQTHVLTAPWAMSFPGGRYQKQQLDVAHQHGFEQVFTSAIGPISQQAWQTGQGLPRFAIRNGHSLDDFTNILALRGLRRAQAVAYMKQMIKQLFGHKLYHRMYQLKARLRG